MENQAYLWLKNRNIDIVVAIGVQEGGISKVPWNVISSMTHHIISPCKLWHRRLGHLHFRELPGLQRMVKGMPSFYSIHATICWGCALGKNVKNKFPRNHTRFKGILYLFHWYVCGSMSSPSLSGSLYYILSIHDFSRKT